MPRHIDVAFTPAEAQQLARKVVIVIDLVRSTSTLAVIMSRGPSRVLIAPTIQKAQKFAAQQTIHPLLCGERGGRRPEGFDHGNSPREYADLSLSGKTIVFTSSNGARAMMEVGLAPRVLLGSLLNARAVVAQTLQYAREQDLDILLVCAGQEEKFALDDTYAAGFLVSRLINGMDASEEFVLGDGGQGALGIFGYYQDSLRLVQQSMSGKLVTEIGLADDLPYLLQPDLLDAVPRLAQRDQLSHPWEFSLIV